ncbi:hypothetical protein CEUSTIGMA_g9259.t1 [Chlamydomonas eustigma]|uniref:Nucleotide-diphospho-sugar transferase domain-containing protein n=1 Tax=Chlamydomonas eustigma TaxID=1157962 RepID=A0A250XFH6_9CHLO|nr:hypothetical protein CEUSTIGMA_g9259.t1 [Chlamydomonas eustigma]|eukprot:GAX81831.1 hypothetical protein CEUSTIGMA_g9259.t1 [Chlamydomonas eustigma]
MDRAGVKRKARFSIFNRNETGNILPELHRHVAPAGRPFRGGALALIFGIVTLVAAIAALLKIFHVTLTMNNFRLSVKTEDNYRTSISLPKSCEKLSKQLLDKWAKNNTVMITFTDHQMFKLFGSTWLHNLEKAGITYWVVAVADNKTADLVLKSGAHHCFMAEDMEVDDLSAEFKWGSSTWKLHTWQKVLTVRHVHHMGYHVVQSDMDVVWFRDPLMYFNQKYTLPDYMVSLDPITTRNPLGDDGPEVGITVSHYMNTGVYFLRNTSGGSALIDKWYEIRKSKQAQGFHDQDGLYKYLTVDQREEIDGKNRISKVVDGKVKLAQLPATQFQNGYSHCINKVHKVHNLMPYETHFVWVDGNNNGKMHRMREGGYFYDPPSYYTQGGAGPHVVVSTGGSQGGSQGGEKGASFTALRPDAEAQWDGLDGFLSVDLTPIETPSGFNEWRNITNDTEKMVSHHLVSLEAQLTEVVHAFALAWTLNRTLILPKIQCWCIQNWFENPLCRLPGELHTQFPFPCPADYIFQMNKLYSFEVRGRRVPIREYSFLENKRTAPAIKENPLLLRVSSGEKQEAVYDKQAHVLLLPPEPSDATVVSAFEPFSKPFVRVHVEAPLMTKVIQYFKEPQLQTEFDQVISQLSVKWCCRPESVAKAHGLPIDHQLVMKSKMKSNTV